MVGTGDNRAVKAQVTITSRTGRTELRIARVVRDVLASAPSLSAH